VGSALDSKTRKVNMLVLSRKQGQSIYIGDNVRITVIVIDSEKIRLGIDAPPDVSVDREEVRRAKQCKTT
jgi:carbon storage regulator